MAFSSSMSVMARVERIGEGHTQCEVRLRDRLERVNGLVEDRGGRERVVRDIAAGNTAAAELRVPSLPLTRGVCRTRTRIRMDLRL